MQQYTEQHWFQYVFSLSLSLVPSLSFSLARSLSHTLSHTLSLCPWEPLPQWHDISGPERTVTVNHEQGGLERDRAIQVSGGRRREDSGGRPPGLELVSAVGHGYATGTDTNVTKACNSQSELLKPSEHSFTAFAYLPLLLLLLLLLPSFSEGLRSHVCPKKTLQCTPA